MYSEIFNQGVGCELYLYAPEKAPWLLGVPYKQARMLTYADGC